MLEINNEMDYRRPGADQYPVRGRQVPRRGDGSSDRDQTTTLLTGTHISQVKHFQSS